MTEFQRDAVASIEEWRESVEELREEVEAAGSTREAARARGRLGDYLRLRSETVREAVELLAEAVELAEAADAPRLVVSNLIRSATALQYAGRHDRARAVFERAIRRARQLPAPSYEGFARQHLGKCLVEGGEYPEARRQLERALAIRRDLGDTSLVDSTERALDGLDERVSGG